METGRSSRSRHEVGRWGSELRQKADAADGPNQRLPCWVRLSSVARMSFRDRGGLRYKDLPVRPSIRTTPALSCKARLNDCPRSGHTYAPCQLQRVVVQRGHSCDSRMSKPHSFSATGRSSSRPDRLRPMSFSIAHRNSATACGDAPEASTR